MLFIKVKWTRLPLQDYDLQGDYIRTWIPELAIVPASRIHEPWLMSKQVRQN